MRPMLRRLMVKHSPRVIEKEVFCKKEDNLWQQQFAKHISLSNRFPL